MKPNKPYYECHITFLSRNARAASVVKEQNWKHSKIDGDPVLGEGIKQYATNHYPGSMPLEHVVDKMREVSQKLNNLDNSSIVLRIKVESIVFDEIY